MAPCEQGPPIEDDEEDFEDDDPPASEDIDEEEEEDDDEEETTARPRETPAQPCTDCVSTHTVLMCEVVLGF